MGSIYALEAAVTVLSKHREGAKNQEALVQAAAIREIQLAEIQCREEGLLESVYDLEAAVAVLSKHKSFVQVPSNRALSVATNLQHLWQKHDSMLKGVFTRSELKAAAAVSSPQAITAMRSQPSSSLRPFQA